MTNYEWLKTLDVETMAKILAVIPNIYLTWIGNRSEIIQRWLLSERVDCKISSSCFCADSPGCAVCWLRCVYEEEE